LKGSKHNYQLDQVLESFKYSFYFDGITLRTLQEKMFLEVEKAAFAKPFTAVKAALHLSQKGIL